MKKIAVFLLLFTLACKDDDTNCDSKDKEPVEFKHSDLYTGLQNPWGLDFLWDESILITERPGRLQHYENGVLTEVSGLPSTITAISQGGLMDILVYSSTKNNTVIYFTATNEVSGVYSTALFRANYAQNSHSLSNVEKIYQATPLLNSGSHFGSRLVIDDQDYIYLGLGERGDMNLAQDRTNSSGSVVRLNLDGSIPTSNPFVSVTNSVDEIWSYGHRNIQGLVIHPKTKEIWSHEHGPKGGDEINIITKGGNYGWPLATYGLNYDGTVISDSTHISGTLQPELFWTPSIAPCGMEIYSGKVFPQWTGNIFIGALASQHLNRVSIDGKVMEEERLFQDYGRFRAVKEGKDGLIYLLSEANGGKLSRIEKKY